MLRLLFRGSATPAPARAPYSFNDPRGMCPACEGIGWVRRSTWPQLIDDDKSLNEGALDFPTSPSTLVLEDLHRLGLLRPRQALGDYTAEERQQLLLPARDARSSSLGAKQINTTYEGVVAKLAAAVISKELDGLQAHPRRGRADHHARTCDACDGTRLNEAALNAGSTAATSPSCSAMQARELAAFIAHLTAPTSGRCWTRSRAGSSTSTIGLGYLSLDRESATLSGGESQRVKMVRHLGSSLTGMTYVFDEPSIGLHPHDVGRLTELLGQLRDKGNTVLVVEHEPDVISRRRPRGRHGSGRRAQAAARSSSKATSRALKRATR